MGKRKGGGVQPWKSAGSELWGPAGAWRGQLTENQSTERRHDYEGVDRESGGHGHTRSLQLMPLHPSDRKGDPECLPATTWELVILGSVSAALRLCMRSVMRSPRAHTRYAFHALGPGSRT